MAIQHIGYAAGMASLKLPITKEVKDERWKIAGISYGVAMGVAILYLIYAMYMSRGKTFSWGRRIAAMVFIFFLVAFGVYMAIPKEYEMDYSDETEETKKKKKDITQQVHTAAIATAGAITVVGYMMKF